MGGENQKCDIVLKEDMQKMTDAWEAKDKLHQRSVTTLENKVTHLQKENAELRGLCIVQR